MPVKEVIEAELDRIRRENNGLLSPGKVVEVATPLTSPIHECFEWNNDKAGHEFRLWQARKLISLIIIPSPVDAMPIRKYYSLVEDRHDEGGYRCIVNIMSDDDQREALLAQALAELEHFEKKFGQLTELSELFDAVKNIRAKKLAKVETA
jgi:hypothetical protein